MKKFMSILFAGVATLVLSACGGGSGGIDSGFDEVDIYDLHQGFLVTANIVNLIDEPEIEIQFCGNLYDIYDYSLNSYIDSGDFTTGNFYIDFRSDIYATYSLDTFDITDDFLVVGETYPVDGEDWRISFIELIDCP